MLHDLLNGHSVNRHEQKNPFSKFSKLQENNHTLAGEIDNVIQFTSTLAEETVNYIEEIIVVNSNHDAWIESYLINSDWKKDIPNALEYMKYSTMMLKNETPKGVFAAILDDAEIYHVVTTLALDESYRIKDWELGVHGHEGTNGSRGNPNQFKKLSTKMITGHTHSPSRIDGVVTVGTSTFLRVGYNTGASGWLQSHAIINADGKVQQIHCINYKFTTLL
ncbi:DNA transfer protein [Maribacter phage Panino]